MEGRIFGGSRLTRAALGMFLTTVFGLAVMAATLPRATPTPPVPMPTAWTTMRLSPSLDAILPGAAAPHWTFASGGGFSSSPVVVDGIAYLSDNSGNLSAIDVTSGALRWHTRFAAPLMAAPLSQNGLVYVGEGDENSTTFVPRQRVHVGLSDNALIAVDAGTGQMKWRFRLKGTGMPTPVLVDGMLIHHDGYGDLIALDAATGVVRWERDVRSASSMSAVLPIGNGWLVTAGIFPNQVFAFKALNSATVWTRPFPMSDSGLGDCPLAFDGTRLFGTYLAPVGKPVDPGVPGTHHVYALRASDGTLLWDHPLETDTTPPRNEAAIPIVVNGIVYDGSAVAPYMHALDAKTGRLLWKRQVKGPVKGAPVEIGGILYFGDLHGYLWALDAKTGAVRGALRTGVRFNVGSPIVVGRSLLVGSLEGIVVMLPLAEIAGGKDA